jgi:RNA polymerase sigma-70 factor (ECF subfamily)
VPISANGSPAFAQYKPDPDGGYSAWSLQVLDVSGDRITGIMFFLDVEAFYPLFDLPLRLEA